MSTRSLHGHRVQFAAFAFRAGTHCWKGNSSVIEGGFVEECVSKATDGEGDFEVFRYDTNKGWQPTIRFSGRPMSGRVVPLPTFDFDQIVAVAVVIYPSNEGPPINQIFPPRWW